MHSVTYFDPSLKCHFGCFKLSLNGCRLLGLSVCLIQGQSKLLGVHHDCLCLQSCGGSPLRQLTHVGGSGCTLCTFGDIFNANGETTVGNKWQRYEHMAGSMHEGTVVTILTDNTRFSECQVAANGQVCPVCTVVSCLDGAQVLNVLCDDIPVETTGLTC